MILLHLPLNLILWAAYEALTFPFWLLGFPVVGLASLFERWHIAVSKRYPEKHSTITAWNSRIINAVYGNDEDGVAGDDRWWPSYCQIKATKSKLGKIWLDERFQTFVWSAWRNPTNNVRFIPVLHPKPNPSKLRYVGNSKDPDIDRNGRFLWFYAWQGIYGGLWLMIPRGNKYLQIRLGWKLMPKDIAGVTDYRRFRYPFALQTKMK